MSLPKVSNTNLFLPLNLSSTIQKTNSENSISTQNSFLAKESSITSFEQGVFGSIKTKMTSFFTNLWCFLSKTVKNIFCCCKSQEKTIDFDKNYAKLTQILDDQLKKYKSSSNFLLASIQTTTGEVIKGKLKKSILKEGLKDGMEATMNKLKDKCESHGSFIIYLFIGEKKEDNTYSGTPKEINFPECTINELPQLVCDPADEQSKSTFLADLSKFADNKEPDQKRFFKSLSKLVVEKSGQPFLRRSA